MGAKLIRMLKVAAAVTAALVVTAGVALAAPAGADEDSYVVSLDQHGVYYSSIWM